MVRQAELVGLVVQRVPAMWGAVEASIAERRPQLLVSPHTRDAFHVILHPLCPGGRELVGGRSPRALSFRVNFPTGGSISWDRSSERASGPRSGSSSSAKGVKEVVDLGLFGHRRAHRTGGDG